MHMARNLTTFRVDYKTHLLLELRWCKEDCPSRLDFYPDDISQRLAFPYDLFNVFQFSGSSYASMRYHLSVVGLERSIALLWEHPPDFLHGDEADSVHYFTDVVNLFALMLCCDFL